MIERQLPMRVALFLGLAACGGPPLLQNAPRPNPSAVAGAAAAVAGAATLADPAAAARHQEQHAATVHKSDRHDVHEVDVTVPADVLDRLDDAGVDAR